MTKSGHEAIKQSKTTAKPGKRTGFALFILLFTLYFLSSSGGFHIVDEVSLFALTESLAKRGAFDTNAIAWMQWVNSPGEVLGAFGPEGDVYSKKGPAPAFLAVPLYLLAWAIPGVGLIQATLLYNALVTAITALLLWGWTRRLGYGHPVGMAVALTFGLGTLAWPYATHYFGEPTSALSLVGAGYALTRWRASQRPRDAFLAGLALAGMMATVTAHVLLIPVFILYALWTESPHLTIKGRSKGQRERGRWRWPEARSAAAFLAPLVAIAIALAGYNWARFGDPLHTGYHFDAGEGWTTPLWQGLWGLLFSPYRGLIWYTPLSLAAVLAWPSFWRVRRAEAGLIAGLTAVLVVLYSLWWMWWGGFAWGPRFLVPLCPFLALSLAPWWARLSNAPRLYPASSCPLSPPKAASNVGDGAMAENASSSFIALLPYRLSPILRIAFVALIALSVLVQLLAVIANYAQYEVELRDIYPTDWDDPLRYGPPALYNPLHSPILGQIRLLWRDPLGASDLFWLRPDAIVWQVPAGGAVVLALAGWLLWRSGRENVTPGRARPAALTLAFLLWVGYALAEASRDPRFGRPGEGYWAALDAMEARARPDDVIVTVAPYHYHVPMDRYRGRLPIFGYAQEEPLHSETAQVLSRLLAQPRNVWLITGGLLPADPSNGVERWLAERGYKASDEWFGDFRLVRFLSPVVGMAPSPVKDVTFGDQVILAGAAMGPMTLAPGDGLRVAVGWVALQPLEIDYVVFIQLLDAKGQLRAQHDSPPVGGYRPTRTWAPGEPIEDHLGVALPPDLTPGDYTVILGMYDPVTGERLPASTGGDFVTLGQVTVIP
ncbi:MAG: hypothetical protein RML36_08020 [Anaerolineae bacterium]|nr:hypothetical protein [Anaerolineae bacterium]MDW8099410.1 hypothetical protein [Anaerolineae bacterium]